MPFFVARRPICGRRSKERESKTRPSENSDGLCAFALSRFDGHARPARQMPAGLEKIRPSAQVGAETQRIGTQCFRRPLQRRPKQRVRTVGTHPTHQTGMVRTACVAACRMCGAATHAFCSTMAVCDAAGKRWVCKPAYGLSDSGIPISMFRFPPRPAAASAALPARETPAGFGKETGRLKFQTAFNSAFNLLSLFYIDAGKRHQNSESNCFDD